VTRSHLRRRFAAIGLTLGVVVLTACGSDAKVTETTDGKVTVSGRGKKAAVTITGEHGATATYNAQRVPADFPSEVPLPRRVTLESATSATRGGKPYFQLTYTYRATSARATLGAYATQLGTAGFAVDSVDGATSDTAPSPFRADGSGWQVTALATSGGGAGSMVVTVANS
jgi:hypothetical protein